MKFLAVFALVAAVAATNVLIKDTPFTEEETSTLFTEFKRMYNKQYEVKEESFRYEIFRGYVEFIRAHNIREREGKETYKTAMNHLCDLTHEEYKKMYLSHFNRTRPLNVEILSEVATLTGSNDAGVDWRSKGAVTPVKNQGQCGSCWSFSTTGSIEGRYQIATGKLESLSEQQLMDCSVAEGDHGCNGGLMDYAFEYVEKNGGIDSESDYPYTARDGSCNSQKQARHVAYITGFKDVAHNQESQLKAAVAQGPVSVAIEADQRGFQTYHSGVFSGQCGTQLDHGVLTVGYGTEGSQDYWIVKNSWGASWGDQGYIKMAQGVGASGICGIAMQPSYPVAKSGPAPPPPPPSPPSPSPSPSPSGDDYEDPNPSGCHSNEQAVQIQGLAGSYCAPSCSTSTPCPAPPSGTTAQAECVVEQSGSSQPTLCALICQPGAETGGCPGTATCKPIQGTGVCTYDS